MPKASCSRCACLRGTGETSANTSLQLLLIATSIHLERGTRHETFPYSYLLAPVVFFLSKYNIWSIIRMSAEPCAHVHSVHETANRGRSCLRCTLTFNCWVDITPLPFPKPAYNLFIYKNTWSYILILSPTHACVRHEVGILHLDLASVPWSYFSWRHVSLREAN